MDWKKLCTTPEFWIQIWTSTSSDPQLQGLKMEMKFDLSTMKKSPQELAEWYANLFAGSRVFDPDTGIEDFIGIEKEVKALLMENRH